MLENAPYKTIGTKIRELRNEKGMTQEQLASQLYCTRENIHFYEKGTVNIFAYSLWNMAKIFNVSIGDFFPGQGPSSHRVPDQVHVSPYEINKEIGRKMRSARKDRKINAQNLGDKLGISKRAVYLRETGQSLIRASSLWELSVLLHVEVGEFFPFCDREIIL